MSTKASTTALKAPPRRKRLLAPSIRIGRAPNWEGELEGARGAAEGCLIRIKARIGFDYAMLEGEGRAVNLPAEGYVESFAVSGLIDGEAVSLQIHFNGEPFGRQPFLCDGILSGDGREMAGQWSIACFNPDTCGCAGGGGHFRLKLVE